MSVSRTYRARSGAGTVVAVGSGVFDAVGKGVLVEKGMAVEVGNAAGDGEGVEQDESRKMKTKRVEMDD